MAAEAGLELDEAAALRLVNWMAAVLAENAVQNLTRITDPEAFARDHVVDGLAGGSVIPFGASVVDVGSGAGFPGVALAYARPDLRVTLVEASLRRARFLARSGLPVVRARAEDFARGDGRDAFDVAVTRAVAPPAVAAELALPLVRPGGRAVLWLGRDDPAERAHLARVAGALGGEIERVIPSLGRRQLVVVAKRAATPARFPRRSGVAARRPL